MSGHSKWHNIAAKKGKADAARGKIFTKLGRELLVAVKEGGPDPAGNSKLKDVIAKCKANKYDTQPDVPKFPPALSNACLTSAAVLFLLSVLASTITATPLVPYPSYITSS